MFRLPNTKLCDGNEIKIKYAQQQDSKIDFVSKTGCKMYVQLKTLMLFILLLLLFMQLNLFN